MIQATGDTGTQWILDLCSGMVKEGSIPEDWKSSVVLPIYRQTAVKWLLLLLLLFCTSLDHFGFMLLVLLGLVFQ